VRWLTALLHSVPACHTKPWCARVLTHVSTWLGGMCSPPTRPAAVAAHHLVRGFFDDRARVTCYASMGRLLEALIPLQGAAAVTGNWPFLPGLASILQELNLATS
jgi:hypothetical protein